MKPVPFHDWSEEGAPHFYCLATCDGIYQPGRAAVAATAALYFSPSPDFARFCVQMFKRDGHRVLYHRGPVYSTSPEAALLDAWCNYDIAPWNWFLYAHPAPTEYANAEHAALYLRARKELGAALYWNGDLRHLGSFGPPAAGFKKRSDVVDAPENSELLWSAVELDPEQEEDEEE